MNDPLLLWTKEIFSKYNNKPLKRFGQHFLISDKIRKTIIESADLQKNDIVIEIGAGFGTLTFDIAKYCKKVIAVEIDKLLCEILRKEMQGYENIQVINSDILKIDFNELLDEYAGKEIKVIGSLPYYITGPILEKIVYMPGVKIAVIVVQSEVAKRMISRCDSSDYGALSIFVQYKSVPKIISGIPSCFFLPNPKVDSKIVKLSFSQHQNKEKVKDEHEFFSMIRMLFSQRRKTIKNALLRWNKNSKNVIFSADDILKDNNISSIARVETLSVSQLVKLHNSINRLAGSE